MLSLCTLEISWVPFKLHSLISFLLTSSHYMIAFCWFCPIFPLQTVYKMLCFLHSLCKTSWPQLSCLLYFSSQIHPVTDLSLPGQADRFLPSIMVRKAIISPAHLWTLHAKIMTGWPVCELLQQWHKHNGKTHYFLNEFTALSTTQYPHLAPWQRWESAAKQVTDLGENS